MSADMTNALQACSDAIGTSRKQSTEAHAKVNRMNKIIEERHAALNLVHQGFQKLASIDSDYKEIANLVDDGATSSFRVEDLAQVLFPSTTRLNSMDENPIADVSGVDIVRDLQKQLALVQDQLKIKDAAQAALQMEHQEAKEKLAILTSNQAANSTQPAQGNPLSGGSPANTEPGLGQVISATSSVENTDQDGRSPAQMPDFDPNKRLALVVGQGGPAQTRQITLKANNEIVAMFAERGNAKKEVRALISGTSGSLRVRCTGLMRRMLMTGRPHTARVVLQRPWLVRRPWLPEDEDPGYPETTVGGHALRLYILISGSGAGGFKLLPALGIIEKLVGILPYSHFKGVALAYPSIMDATRLAHFELSSVSLRRLFHFAILGLGNTITERFGNIRPPSLFSVKELNDTATRNLVDEVTRILRADPNNNPLHADLENRYPGRLRRYSAIIDKGPLSTVGIFLAIPEQSYFVVADFNDCHILVVHRSMCGVEDRPQWMQAERKTFFVQSPLRGVPRILIPAMHNWGIEDLEWWDSLVRSH